MNQKQREYLIEQVEKTWKQEREKYKCPSKPSLNNYLIAAFLDNTIKLRDVNELKVKIRERVLKMGVGDILIQEDSRFGRDSDRHIKLEPLDIVVPPDAYLKAMEDYETERNRIDGLLNEVNAVYRTIIMKIQVGSDKALQAVVDQVDNLTDLSLVNAQLTLKAISNE